MACTGIGCILTKAMCFCIGRKKAKFLTWLFRRQCFGKMIGMGYDEKQREHVSVLMIEHEGDIYG